ncbi:hypothetical protein [Natronomonas sp. LN261]|uniref:hypothetical protein n=1 Tax=Natronomonas sp. LN261 TaxID=2750669 RepID=UPI0015EE4F81|nr:hypothetical protein [Natronomonas sp. LN261]
MQTLPSATTHLGVVFGVLCAIGGLAFQGPEGGVFWSFVGYFLGKSIQSTVWAFGGEHTA